jgi:hypothetical protein
MSTTGSVSQFGILPVLASVTADTAAMMTAKIAKILGSSAFTPLYRAFEN